MRLRDQLAVIEPAAAPWVQAVLCLPFAHVTPPHGRAACRGVWVVNEDDLVEAVQDRADKRRRLSKPEQSRWTAAVAHLAGRQAAGTPGEQRTKQHH